jgi:hypothetical protein
MNDSSFSCSLFILDIDSDARGKMEIYEKDSSNFFHKRKYQNYLSAIQLNNAESKNVDRGCSKLSSTHGLGIAFTY